MITRPYGDVGDWSSVTAALCRFAARAPLINKLNRTLESSIRRQSAIPLQII